MKYAKEYNEIQVYYSIKMHEEAMNNKFCCVDHTKMQVLICEFRATYASGSFLSAALDCKPLKELKLYNKSKYFSIMIVIPFLAAIISCIQIYMKMWVIWNSKSILVTASYIMLYGTVVISNASAIREITKILKEYGNLENLFDSVKKEANII